jgi:hypothetical protein
MPDKLWKKTERMIAARLGGRRVPITGRQRGDVPDIAHDVYSIEVKSRKTLPTWLREAVAQAVAAQRGTQLPVAILHQRGTRHDDDLVVLRLADFEGWCGAAQRESA